MFGNARRLAEVEPAHLAIFDEGRLDSRVIAGSQELTKICSTAPEELRLCNLAIS